MCTWCACHGVHYVLQFGKSFDPNWPKTSFLAPDPNIKVFVRFDDLIRPRGHEIF